MQHEECRAAAPPNRRSCVVQPREAAEGPKALVVAGRASRQARYLSSGRQDLLGGQKPQYGQIKTEEWQAKTVGVTRGELPRAHAAPGQGK